jgi:sec-independent protein translocase protein TatC
MSRDSRNIDPDDFFSETRMSFGDHIEDLRVHLWRAIKGFVIACVFGFVIGKSVLAFIAHPVEKQLQAFYERRVAEVKKQLEDNPSEELREANQASAWQRVAFPADQIRALVDKDVNKVNNFPRPADLNGEEEKPEVFHLWFSFDNPVNLAIVMQKAQQLVGRRPALSTLSVQEAFVVYLKVSLVTGFVLGSPWIFFQIWSFIAVGLYPHEKRYINVYLPFSVVLFITGVAVCEFLVIPKAVEALLWFNEWIGLEPDLRLSEWLGFAIMMPLVFGLSFQTPLVMLFLNRIGIMSVEGFREKRRIIWFCMAVFAAIITPSTDPYSMCFLWIPLCLLFELGIWLCLMSPPATPWDIDIPEEEEVVEV